VSAAPTVGFCYEYPLRPDFVAQAVLPRDLTPQEAARICAFIRSLAEETWETA
jgi:hypothetical protein